MACSPKEDLVAIVPIWSECVVVSTVDFRSAADAVLEGICECDLGEKCTRESPSRLPEYGSFI